jgi:hypothetical protein
MSGAAVGLRSRLSATAPLAALSAMIGLSASGLCATSTSAQEVRLGEVRAHLYLERSGRLSDDILKLRDARLADLPRGEGVFGEPANTVILNIELIGAPNSQPKHATALVNITTTNRTGQRRTETRPLMGFVFGQDGRLNRPVVLENITCSKVEIEVKVRSAARRALLDFACSEPKSADAGERPQAARR